MNELEPTDENLNKIAIAEFTRMTGEISPDKSAWIVAEWRDHAREMIENYNRVVEILGLDAGCKCGDHTTDDKLGYDCRVANH